MKYFLFVLLLVSGMSNHLYAADGYKIKLKFTDADLKGQICYIAHYYAKPLPTIYKNDSAYFDKSGTVTFIHKEKFVGGIYLMMLSDKKTYFEFLLDNGADIDITASVGSLPLGVRCQNSPENERFQEYAGFLKNYTSNQQLLQSQFVKAKSHADSTSIIEKSATLNRQLKEYRKDYCEKYPGTILANIFGALQSPEIPANRHFMPDGKTVDTVFAYNYYKEHYWDGFDFTDDRLINTPLYDGKLQTYFNNVILHYPDSVQKEGDMLLAKTRGHNELFKYTLYWVTQYAQDSKVMGMDQAFVYFVENYHMKGDAFWMDHDLLFKYIDRAKKIAPNVIGNIAPEIKMIDWNKKEHNLSEVKAKYTLLVFWSPDCGHCQSEIPQIDSVYKAVLKKKGVQVFAVKTEGDDASWKSFLEKHNINEWTNVYDPEHKSNYKAQYDVYGTPVIYLLDEKKTIRGKKLDHSNIESVIDMIESKNKALNKKS